MPRSDSSRSSVSDDEVGGGRPHGPHILSNAQPVARKKPGFDARKKSAAARTWQAFATKLAWGDTPKGQRPSTRLCWGPIALCRIIRLQKGHTHKEVTGPGLGMLPVPQRVLLHQVQRTDVRRTCVRWTQFNGRPSDFVRRTLVVGFGGRSRAIGGRCNGFVGRPTKVRRTTPDVQRTAARGVR